MIICLYVLYKLSLWRNISLEFFSGTADVVRINVERIPISDEDRNE